MGEKSSGLRRVIEFVAVLAAGSVIAGLIWLYTTDAGKDLRKQMGELKFPESVSPEQEVAAEKYLKAAHAMVFRNSPPDNYVSTVNVFNQDIGDEGFKDIAVCRRLDGLVLNGCKVSDRQMSFLAGLDHMGSLVMDDCQVGDPALPQLEKLSGLITLNLKGTPITDAALPHIARLKLLKSLNITATHVTDAGLKALGEMPDLEWILLADDDVSDAGLASLENLPSLHQITAVNTKVSEGLVNRWKKSHPTVIIDLKPRSG